jgi:UDP-N-acetyl-D-galactosamine dehydrogenase
MILAVPHREYLSDPTLLSRVRPGGVFIDVKSAIAPTKLDPSVRYWSL